MIDIVRQINDTHREVNNQQISGEGGTVKLRRTYNAPLEEVWDACTDPIRITRWFLPISGDLSAGGTYQLKGNAGGEIVRCDPPHFLKVTWEFGDGPPSVLEVKLSEVTKDTTLLELEHSSLSDPEFWVKYGPGAVGVGWDLALLGLGMHLGGQTLEDPIGWQVSSDAKSFIAHSSQAWGTAHEASGATAAQAAKASKNTADFFTHR